MDDNLEQFSYNTGWHNQFSKEKQMVFWDLPQSHSSSKLQIRTLLCPGLGRDMPQNPPLRITQMQENIVQTLNTL